MHGEWSGGHAPRVAEREREQGAQPSQPQKSFCSHERSGRRVAGEFGSVPLAEVSSRGLEA